jgi:hypothetical protein
MLEGHQKAVSIGKKSPDAIKEGDTVHGTITETQYDADKFKSESPGYSGNKGGGKQPMDSTTMYVSYAKDVLVAMIDTKKPFTIEDYKEYIKHISEQGKLLKSLVESEGLKDKWNQIQADKVRETVLEVQAEIPPADACDDIDEEEPINLDDIPF